MYKTTRSVRGDLGSDHSSELRYNNSKSIIPKNTDLQSQNTAQGSKCYRGAEHIVHQFLRGTIIHSFAIRVYRLDNYE